MTPFEQFRSRLLDAKKQVRILERVWKRLTVLSTEDEINQLIEDADENRKPKYP